jgi:hypothetical protein
MEASYYRMLARAMLADADMAEDPAIAARFRERAEEYLLLAQALEQAAQPETPPPAPREAPQQPAQQQQQRQPDPPESESEKD